MKSSRRRFLKLMAAGSAALMSAPAAGMARAATKPKTKPASAGGAKSSEAAKSQPIPAAVRAEIEKQKGFTAQALKAVRDYPLPPGSPMAFVFKPMKARPKKDRTS